MLNPQTPQNSLLDTSLHSREKTSSSTHQNTGTSSPQPGNLDKPLVQPHPQGEDAVIKRNHKLPACRKGTQTQQSNQNVKAEKYSAGEGTC